MGLLVTGESTTCARDLVTVPDFGRHSARSNLVGDQDISKLQNQSFICAVGLLDHSRASREQTADQERKSHDAHTVPHSYSTCKSHALNRRIRVSGN